MPQFAKEGKGLLDFWLYILSPAFGLLGISMIVFGAKFNLWANRALSFNEEQLTWKSVVGLVALGGFYMGLCWWVFPGFRGLWIK